MKALIVVTPPPAPLDRLGRDGLLRLCGVPALEIQVDLLRRHGVREILLLLGTGSEAVETHFGDGRRFGVRIASLWSRQALPTLGDLRTAEDFLDDSFLLLNTRALVATNLRRLLTEHNGLCAQSTIALAEEGSAHVDTDLMVIQREALTALPATLQLSGSADLGNAMADNGALVHRISLPLNWQPITTPAQYLEAHWRSLRQEWPSLDQYSTMPAPELRCGMNVRINPQRVWIQGPVQIDGGAEVQDGARLIGPCHIGAGALIEAGACIERSIVFPHVHVSGHAHLCEAITDVGFYLLADGTSIELAHADLDWLISDRRQPARVRAASEQRFLDCIG